MHVRGTFCVAMLALACGGEERDDTTDAAGPDAAEEIGAGPVGAEAQREGDAAAGYQALVTEGYVGCGIPYSAHSQVFQAAPVSMRAPGRTGPGETLAYNYNRFTTSAGVDVVSPNCLQCHAETLRGDLVIGLGNHTTDFTADIGMTAILAGGFVDDPAERPEYERWRDRVVTVAPYTRTRTVGVNPADNLAAVLFAHRDRDTLAWSPSRMLDYPPNIVVPVDVPAWWHMKKKNAMFYTAAGRGDHARIMMTASTLCIDSVEEARAIDAYFPDVRSYLLSLEPPAWPHAVDPELAASGKVVFERSCARCHGSYGDEEDYPNLVIAASEIGTDPTLALGASQFAERFLDWFNGSFFGELARLERINGYIAPPLDGVWATAPYFHNGSVPTVAQVLDSALRPKYWTRSFGTSDADYDRSALGWKHEAVPEGHEDVPSSKRRLIYDTTQLGYGNGGHTFGDDLSTEERTAVIEYLKTL